MNTLAAPTRSPHPCSGAFDDGFGPALYVVRNRDGPNWTRWNGAAWENLREGPGDALRGITSPFLAVNGGANPALLFGGSWNDPTGQFFLLRLGRTSGPCP